MNEKENSNEAQQVNPTTEAPKEPATNESAPAPEPAPVERGPNAKAEDARREEAAKVLAADDAGAGTFKVGSKKKGRTTEHVAIGSTFRDLDRRQKELRRVRVIGYDKQDNRCICAVAYGPRGDFASSTEKTKIAHHVLLNKGKYAPSGK